jgi:trehalose 6-phosphate synthase/phosphatase
LPSTIFNYLPVFINQPVYDAFYGGFAKSVIWPLFHYFPSYAEYNPTSFNNYLKGNELFLEVLRRYLRPNDTIWIQDYHLMPLAAMIREEFPNVSIGFFLHIPFPSYEIIRLIPRKWQASIINGMLGADLIGFHTIDYASHFLKSVQMIMGLDSEMNVLLHDNRLIKVDVFPSSIDYSRFNAAFDNERVASARISLKEKFKDRKVIFSLDRLDYTKGLQNRLKAYEHFLIHNPEYIEKVVFLLLVEPFFDNVARNTERKKIVDEAVSHINNKFGNSNWQPLIYQYSSLRFEEMVVLYTACDIALITPLRDGMNLISKEFISSRKDQQGVLILSETAGAARELTDSLTINPNDIVEISDQVRVALEMTSDEQTQRMENMQSRIKQYDITAWVDDFLQQLDSIKKRQLKFQIRFIDEPAKRAIFDSYRKSKRRLLLLDYDGTLVSFASLPLEAKPDIHLIELLESLTKKEENEVYIISGRESVALENWIGHIPLNIISEHGARIKLKGKGWQTQVLTSYDWKPTVRTIMNSYVKRCANSFTEEKDFSVVWHYRNANQDQAKLRSLELIAELSEYTHNLELQVMPGNKIVEVRSLGIDKGKAVRKILLNSDFDFILAAGDDKTDEDMFKVLADLNNVYTIKIGADASYANYNLHTSQMMISMLDAMSTLH